MTVSPQRLEEVPLGLRLAFLNDDPLHIPLHRLPCRPVVRSLALGLLDATNALGDIKTNWTARHYTAAIARFARWLDSQGFAGDLDELTVDHLYEFGRYEESSVERRTRALLRSATPAAGVKRPVTDEVREHLNGPAISPPKPKSTPLRAYTAGEYQRLVAACRAEIESWDQVRPRTLPDARVTLAFRILLGLELGLPPECVDALRVEDLRWQGERDLRVEFVKRRADGPQARTFRASGRWSGPKLIERWLQASAPLRVNEDSGAIWIWSPRPGEAETVRFSAIAWWGRRKAFLQAAGLEDDDGRPLSLDMRRLRTTWTARKSKYWHGAVTVDPNHSAKVEGDNYLTRSADLDEVDTTIEGAQQDLMRRAQAVALVVADEDTLADAVDDPTFATQRGEGSNSSGWDMFAAACRDPFSSPFGPKGTFCTAAVWSCLVCPLAVITPSKLPALMRLEGYLRDQSAAVTQTEWLRIYGPAWVQLTTRIFPKFAESVIAEARRIVEENLDLPMPIEPLES